MSEAASHEVALECVPDELGSAGAAVVRCEPGVVDVHLPEAAHIACEVSVGIVRGCARNCSQPFDMTSSEVLAAIRFGPGPRLGGGDPILGQSRDVSLPLLLLLRGLAGPPFVSPSIGIGLSSRMR